MKYFYSLSFWVILVSILLSSGMINAQTQHFHTCWEGKSPFSPMTVFVIEAKFNGVDLIVGDEIGIFDGILCVGAATIKSTVSISKILEIITSKDDGLTGRGFIENNKIIVKIWRISTNQEFLIEAAGVQFHDLQTGNPIAPVPFSGLGTAAISIKGLGKKGLSYHAKKLPLDMKPPTIDGKLDEPFWSSIKADTLKFGGVPGVWQAPWTDWNNSFVTWKAVWSSITNKLYLAIRIKDDIRGTFDHSNPSDIFFQPWNDECIELFVNPNNAGGLYEGTYDKAQQWFLTGENKIVLDDYPNSSQFTIYTGSDLVSAVSLDSDGNWICEAVINIYTTFPSVGKILTIGDTLGWDIWYDDSDNLRLENIKYQRDFQTGWQYSGAADMNADFMGDLILAGEFSYLILNSPNGGEFWQVDSLKTITWASHNIAGNVKIEISSNSGTTWQPIIASTPNSGSFPWRPTANLISNQCLIKVTSLTDPMISDQSDATFIISNKSKVDLWIDSDLSAGPGGQVILPIKTSDLTGKSAFSCTIVLQYDANVIQLTDTDISGTILAAAGWGKPTIKIGTGQINLAMAGSSELAGSGVLLKIIGNVVGNAGDSTKLHFLSASINEDDPVVFTRDGLLKISKAADIKGRLVYYSDPLIAVKDASVRLTGAASKTSVSDNNGDYEFLSLALSNYTVTPEKINDNKGAITPYDASLVLRYEVGIATLAPYQKIAADVTGNGTVSALDASWILRYCVQAVSQFPIAHDWTFVPYDFTITDANWSTAPRTRSYTPLQTDQLSQNFMSILYGDVSGNWSKSTGTGASITVDVEVGASNKTMAGEWLVPLEIKFLDSAFSGSFNLQFDGTSLKFDSAVTAGRSANLCIENVAFAGKVDFVFASGYSLKDNYLKINFLFDGSRGIAPSPTEFNITDIIVDDNPAIISRVKQPENRIPTEWKLSQSYPNPFNAESIISYQVPKEAHVTIEVFNLLGQKLKTLVNEEKSPGSYQTIWNGKDENGRSVGSGIFVYRMQAGDFSAIRKMVLVQ
jgi:hypothetical protein